MIRTLKFSLLEKNVPNSTQESHSDDVGYSLTCNVNDKLDL